MPGRLSSLILLSLGMPERSLTDYLRVSWNLTPIPIVCILLITGLHGALSTFSSPGHDPFSTIANLGDL